MRISKRKRTPFVTAKNGDLFVEANLIMNPLCAMIDGLPCSYFPPDKSLYLGIDTAIAWVIKEMEYNKSEILSKALEVLKKAKTQLAEGTAIING